MNISWFGEINFTFFHFDTICALFLKIVSLFTYNTWVHIFIFLSIVIGSWCLPSVFRDLDLQHAKPLFFQISTENEHLSISFFLVSKFLSIVDHVLKLCVISGLLLFLNLSHPEANKTHLKLISDIWQEHELHW